MPPVGFEPTLSAGERPQTCALGCAVTGNCEGSIGLNKLTRIYLLLAASSNKQVIKYNVLNQNTRVRSQSLDILIESRTGKQRTIQLHRIYVFYGALLGFFSFVKDRIPFISKEIYHLEA
jgi:hypothetical protein